jgi:hypothetical protein
MVSLARCNTSACPARLEPSKQRGEVEPEDLSGNLTVQLEPAGQRSIAKGWPRDAPVSDERPSTPCKSSRRTSHNLETSKLLLSELALAREGPAAINSTRK